MVSFSDVKINNKKSIASSRFLSKHNETWMIEDIYIQNVLWIQK